MTRALDAVVSLAGALQQYLVQYNVISATVGHPDGSTVEVTGEPGKFWIMVHGDPSKTVKARRAGPKVYGRQVQVAVMTERGSSPEYVILGTDQSVITGHGDQFPYEPYLEEHATSHAWAPGYMGRDPLTVYKRAIFDGRVYPTATPSMICNVAECEYVYDDQRKVLPFQQTIDFTSDLPTTGLAKLAYVLIDGSDNTLAYQYSNTFAWSDYSSSVNSDANVTIAAGRILIGRILLYAGQTSIREIDFKYDARPLFTASLSSSVAYIDREQTFTEDQTIDGVLFIGPNPDMSLYYDSGAGYITTDDNTASDLHLTTGAAKTLVLDTPVFDDLRVPMTSTKLGGSKDPGFAVFKDDGTGPPASQGVFLYWFDASSEEELYFACQMPHGWDQGTIYPHVHWTPKTTADGTPANQTVEWGLEYTWAEIGATFANTSFVYGKTHAPADANVVAGKHYMTSLTSITPSSDQNGISSMLVCRLFRNATDAADDTYEHDAGLLEIDFHYSMDRLGSRTETAY